MYMETYILLNVNRLGTYFLLLIIVIVHHRYKSIDSIYQATLFLNLFITVVIITTKPFNFIIFHRLGQSLLTLLFNLKAFCSSWTNSPITDDLLITLVMARHFFKNSDD